MSNEYFKNIAEAWRQISEKKTLDPVDPKALKGKHADRKDKDIDNDGDVDKSDEYLHNRRKAISKAVKESEDEGEGKGDGKMKPCPKCDGSMQNHDPDCPMADNDDDDDDDMENESSCGKKMKKESVEQVDEAKNYEIKNGKIHISKANFRKVHKDYKNATKGKERMMALDPKTGATTSFQVVFTEELEEAVNVKGIQKAEAAPKLNNRFDLLVGKEPKKSKISYADKQAMKKRTRKRLQKDMQKEAVTHQKWGYGEVIETTDEGANVYFEHGIEFNVPFEDLTMIGEAKKMKGDDPCWKDYEMVGKKMKNGKEVPNCVPKKESVEESIELDEKVNTDKARKQLGMVVQHVLSAHSGISRLSSDAEKLLDAMPNGTKHYRALYRSLSEAKKIADALGDNLRNAQRWDAKLLESNNKETVEEVEEQIQTTYSAVQQNAVDFMKRMWENKQTKGATKPEGIMDKESPKSKAFAKQHDADNPEMVADDEKGHVDATKAGRAVGKQSPTRGGEQRIGDKSIVNPVKGAVTKTTGKE